MTRDELKKLLQGVRSGKLRVDDAVRRIHIDPYEDIACARVDHHRALRCGFPEVIFCQGKRPRDITEISRAILRRAPRLLATRADEPAYRGGRVGGVPIHSVRLPGFVAHQEVLFGAQGQSLTLRHDSYTRESFMPGVLLAVREAPSLTGLVVGLDRLLKLA